MWSQNATQPSNPHSTMTQDNHARDGADRYQTKRLPGGLIRVVDLKNDRVDGVWDQNDKVWFDVHGFLQARSAGDAARGGVQ